MIRKVDGNRFLSTLESSVPFLFVKSTIFTSPLALRSKQNIEVPEPMMSIFLFFCWGWLQILADSRITIHPPPIIFHFRFFLVFMLILGEVRVRLAPQG